ncbi:MAG: DUF421 domain-containing protein [Candidatus Cohnella colombiensis]|uniref:DUF421 domain-containing protein n=1 Tax=Candidatus Cohnella colombiensis TaxID=3121368 RepID=A0AA95F1X6_9BACL|nr:MAG: DUF421 domain-containing protein [Cohnella sp.]
MDLTIILLRTAFMYVFIFVVLRLMGKREIGKLSVFDIVNSIIIAEIAVIGIETPEKSLLEIVTPITFLALIQIATAYLTLKNRKVRRWLDGAPSVLIRHGHINRDEMRKQRYNLDDLMLQLRENGVTNIDEVELAVLESSGKLSVIGRKGDEQQVEVNESFSPKVRYELLPVALILDGQVQDEKLEEVGKTRFWLKNELKSYGIENFKQVFFCSVDYRGKLYVDKKP